MIARQIVKSETAGSLMQRRINVCYIPAEPNDLTFRQFDYLTNHKAIQ